MGVFLLSSLLQVQDYTVFTVYFAYTPILNLLFSTVSTASQFTNGCGTFNSINRYILIYVYYDRKRINYLLKVKKYTITSMSRPYALRTLIHFFHLYIHCIILIFTIIRLYNVGFMVGNHNQPVLPKIDRDMDNLTVSYTPLE